MGPEEPTDELRQDQSRREVQERDLARSAADEEESAQHQRRAEKARYLREKLEERAESEREAAEEEAAG
jgi:hypothetical protein